MTEALAVRQSAPIATRVYVLEGVTFADLVQMGEQLARTGFLPDHIKTGPQFAAIVMTGKELGMAPMRAIRSFHMVKGKVVEDAASQLARFKSAGGRATFDHLDDVKAVLTLTHPNGDKHTETWTIDDAKKAGLMNGMVSKFPRAMLRSRVITAGLKSLGWEGAVGAYDPSELVDHHEPPQTRAPEVLPPQPAKAKGPPAPSPGVKRILDLADLIRTAGDVETLGYGVEHMEDTIAEAGVDEAKAARYRLALNAMVSLRSAELAGEDSIDVSQEAREAAAKLSALVDQVKANA
jgi:hypothetical protein